MKPDILIEVRFKTPEEGGRSAPLQGSFFGCPLFVDGELFDCRLYFEDKLVELGGTYMLPVKFLRPELVMPKLTIGKEIALWEGKIIATGKVVQ